MFRPSLSFNHGAEIHRDPFQVIGGKHLPDVKPLLEVILCIPKSFECGVVRVCQVALCVRFIDNLRQEVCELAEPFPALPQRSLCLFPFGNVPDRLDRTYDLIMPVVKRACFAHERDRFSLRMGKGCIGDQDILLVNDMCIFFSDDLVRFIDQIDKYWLPSPVERDCVLVISLSQHLRGRNPRHLFNGTVPRYYYALGIDCKGCVGQEVDDISFPALKIPNTDFRISLLDSLSDLMRELDEL